jgi:hypothetical protein
MAFMRPILLRNIIRDRQIRRVDLSAFLSNTEVA